MAQTGWTLTGPDGRLEFAEAVRAPLEAEPVRNTSILSAVARLTTESRTAHGEDCYGWWSDDEGRVRAAFVSQAPHSMVLSAEVPAQAAAALPPAWMDSGRARPVGVFGRIETAERIAADWAKLTGGTYRARPKHSMRLFSFDEPTPPDPAPRGTARLSRIEEVELSTRWELGFLADCGSPSDGSDREPLVRSRIEQGRQMAWTVEDVPVAMASLTPMIARSSRIVDVYTPPEHRRRGYAAGLTWAIAQEAVHRGAEHVLLHTDLSNPTSNAIYQRLGFRPVQDVTDFLLED